MKCLKWAALLLSAGALLAGVLTPVLSPPLTAPAWGSRFQRIYPYTDGQFQDMPNDWSADGIRTACELGLMRGSDAGIFAPADSVTLAETVTIAARLHRLYHNGSDDLQQGSPWYAVYVDYALENHILTQYYADYATPATRAQFASILAHALPASALVQVNDIAPGAVPDVSVSHANAREIYLLYRAGVLAGSDEQLSFTPDAAISRAEAAVIIARMALPELRLTLDRSGTWLGDHDLDFTVQTIQGQSFTLSRQAGKVVLLNFWATWDGPSATELFDIQALYEEYCEEDEVVFLAVNVGDSATATKDFAEEREFDFPVACDTDGELCTAYRVISIPRTVIFGKDGTIKADLTGIRSFASLKGAITEALNG